MPGIARVGQDAAGGVIGGKGSTTVLADGKPVSLIGDTVVGHGDAPHTAPTLVSNGANKLLVDNQIPAKEGTVASCGHAVSPGSKTVIVS